MNGLLWGIFAITIGFSIAAVVVEYVQLYRKKMEEYRRSSTSEGSTKDRQSMSGSSRSGTPPGVRHLGK